MERLWHAIDSTRFYCKRAKSVCETEKDDLEILKSRFVLTSVDKAGNNISLICKWFYLNNISEELNSTSTYELSIEEESDIIKNHTLFYKRFNIAVENKCLPFLHMLPKFHKNPIDYRYIAAGTKASTKCLAKILSAMLKLLSTTLQQYSKYKFKFDNTSAFWIVKNKEATLDHLTFLNNIGKTKNIRFRR